jgi:hypothetical protein
VSKKRYERRDVESVGNDPTHTHTHTHKTRTEPTRRRAGAGGKSRQTHCVGSNYPTIVLTADPVVRHPSPLPQPYGVFWVQEVRVSQTHTHTENNTGRARQRAKKGGMDGVPLQGSRQNLTHPSRPPSSPRGPVSTSASIRRWFVALSWK